MNWTRWIPVAALAGIAASAHADDFQVSTGGSIAAAMASAGFGDRVLVQEGTYFEHITLKDGVELRGGYDGSFSEGSRNPLANETIIHGSGTGPAITSGTAVTSLTIVDGFTLTGGGGTPGAGVLVIGGSPIFANNDISGNRRAGAAGGAYVHSASSARFENNTFRDNSSQGSGGGIRIEHSPAVLVGNTFERCVAPHSGGAVYVLNSAVACTSNVYRDCVSGEGGGGGMYLQHATGVKLSGDVFENCRAPYGGGLYARDDAAFTATNVEFNDCTGTSAGGGVGLSNFCTVTFVDCRFQGCSSSGAGGGVWARQAAVSFMGIDATDAVPTALFADCSAVGSGGGVSADSCNGTIQAVRFENCSSDSMGGGYYGHASEYIVRRSAFVSCAAFDGGGIAIRWTQPGFSSPPVRRSTLVNNTFWGCSATGANLAGGIQLMGYGTSINVADLRGNIVANTMAGACIRCGQTTQAAGRPSILCATLNKNPSNPTPEVPGTAANGCVAAFSASPTNRIADPLLCAPPANLQLQICSPDVADNACPQTESKVNRGAAPDGSECPCGGIISALEPTTWGKIKTMYR